MLKEFFLIFLMSQSIGNVINLEMTHQLSDERDYSNETAVEIDESMVNLRQSTVEQDAELIMWRTTRNENIKRRKRQIDSNDDQNPPNDGSDDNPEEPSPSEESPIPEHNASIEKIGTGTSTTLIKNFPMSIITRAMTSAAATQVTTSAAVKNKTTFFTKKPIIFPSESTKTLNSQGQTVGNLARSQSKVSAKRQPVGIVTKGKNVMSSTKRSTAASFQKKGTVKFSIGTTKRQVSVKTTLKAATTVNNRKIVG